MQEDWTQNAFMGWTKYVDLKDSREIKLTQMSFRLNSFIHLFTHSAATYKQLLWVGH